MIPPPDGAYQPAYAALEPSARTGPGGAGGPSAGPGRTSGHEPRRGLGAGGTAGRRVPRPRGRARSPVPLRRRRALFRAMTGVAAYEDALRLAGIRPQVGGRHYYDRSEVGWTIAALAAIEDPHDSVALVARCAPVFRGHGRGAAASPRGRRGVRTAAPPGGRRSGPGRSAGTSRRPPPGAKRVAPAAVVERLLAETEVLAAYARVPQGEARVAGLLKGWTRADARGDGRVHVPRARPLAPGPRAARYEEEESAVEAEDAMRLMTIHKAKGLEFPVVVVPDVGREGRGGRRHRPGRPRIRAPGREPRPLGEPPLTTLDWADAETREIQRVDAERLRVLYVALTRAERAVLPRARRGPRAGASSTTSARSSRPRPTSSRPTISARAGGRRRGGSVSGCGARERPSPRGVRGGTTHWWRAGGADRARRRGARRRSRARSS